MLARGHAGMRTRARHFMLTRGHVVLTRRHAMLTGVTRRHAVLARMTRGHAMLAWVTGLKAWMTRLSLMPGLSWLSWVPRFHPMLPGRHALHLLSRRHAVMAGRHVLLARGHARAHGPLSRAQPWHSTHRHSDIGHRHLRVHLVGHGAREVSGASIPHIVPPHHSSSLLTCWTR